MDAGAFRSRMDREVKSAPRIYVYSSEDRPLSLLQWKRSNVINLPPGVWLGTTGLIAGLGCWELKAWSALVRGRP